MDGDPSFFYILTRPFFAMDSCPPCWLIGDRRAGFLFGDTVRIYRINHVAQQVCNTPWLATSFLSTTHQSVARGSRRFNFMSLPTLYSLPKLGHAQINY